MFRKHLQRAVTGFGQVASDLQDGAPTNTRLLKVPYDPTDKNNKTEAQQIAFSHLREAEDDHEKGLISGGKSDRISKVAEAYLEQAYEQGEANDARTRSGKNPVYPVEGGERILER